jgi:tRNA threonylcarbamoyladenosine biosynthesis protein TsaE
VKIAGSEAMRALGVRLAEVLRVGDLVIASGPLGAGKTTLAQGLGTALAVEGKVTSPTFVIARHHKGAIPLIHVDAYRLRPEGGSAVDPIRALEDLDLESEMAKSVTLIEWGEQIADWINDSYLSVSIEIISDEEREVLITGHGPRWSEWQGMS